MTAEPWTDAGPATAPDDDEAASALDLFARHGTAAVSDALDLLGRGDTGLPGLRRMSGADSVAGPAFTLRFVPVEPGSPAPAADYIDEVPPGAVVVAANDGRADCTVWGDLLSVTAARNGVAGTVIDGMCRDLGAIRQVGYPLWSRGSYMKSGKNRALLESVQQPVTVCGVTVRPGDIVVCDDSGCLFVPAELAEQTAEAVRRVARVEAAIRAELDAGVPLREARGRHGYHALGLRLR